jgi:hypothetical protein
MIEDVVIVGDSHGVARSKSGHRGVVPAPVRTGQQHNIDPVARSLPSNVLG